MTYSVPTSFEPLASYNPVPADTDAMTSLGQQYTTTANLIQSQAETLQNLSNNSSDSWKSQAGTVFVSKASSLATRITQAQQRYVTAGQALTKAAEPMYNAQQQAYAAVQQAQEAQSTMNANAPGPAPAPGSPAPTAAQQAAAKTAASNYSAAEDSLNQATSQFNSAVEDYKDAASAAAKAINHELGSDPLKDSWFQAHFAWLLEFFHILSIIVMALAALALLICLPGVGAMLDLGLGAVGLGVDGGVSAVLSTVSTVIGWGSAAIGVGQTIFDGAAAKAGLENWKSFIYDMVGDVTFGVGQAASKFATSAADAAKGATTDAASTAAKTSVINKATADGAADYIKNNATTVISNDALTAGAKAAGETAGKDADTVSTSAVDKATTDYINTHATTTISNDALAAGAKDAGDAVLSPADAAGAAAADTIEKGLLGPKAALPNTLTNNLFTFGSQNPDIVKGITNLNSLVGTAHASAKIGTAITKGWAGGIVNGTATLGGFSVAGWSQDPKATA
jgi:hypothetical protein